MKPALAALYRHAPVWSRSAAATAWGAYLRSWRYGPETEQLVEQALARESWSENRWRAWQQERLVYVLNRAARQVPYYRQLWAARRRRGDRKPWEHLENWPILDKETLRKNPRAFIADNYSSSKLFREQTSGTTGTPLEIWRSRDSVRFRYALYEARHRSWYGLSRFERWAMLGGQLVTPVREKLPPFWVWNSALRQLYLSSQHLAPRWTEHYLRALEHYRVRYLWGYTSSLYSLARQILEQDLTVSGIEVVITNAEPLNPLQRQAIATAFQCPVRETYGMVEFVAAAGECEHGSLHVWPEVGELEIVHRESALSPGQAGDFVCTGLQNPAMPLIRYRAGDRGSQPDWRDRCPCRRRLPILQRLQGRSNDVLLTPDGRPVLGLSAIFHGQPVCEAQLIQLSLDHIQVRYLPAAGFNAVAKQTITGRLRERLGSARVDFEAVERIPRGANGKFQAVISYVSEPQRAAPRTGGHSNPPAAAPNNTRDADLESPKTLSACSGMG